MAASPVVDGIERQHAGKLIVVRINVQDTAAQPWLARYAFRLTPTFILLDGHGDEAWRSVGSINPDQVAEKLKGL